MTMRLVAVASVVLSGCSGAGSQATFDFLFDDELGAQVIIDDAGTLTATAEGNGRTIELVVQDARDGRLLWNDELPGGLALTHTFDGTTTTEADLDWYVWDHWSSPAEGFEGTTSWEVAGSTQGFTLHVGDEPPPSNPWSCWDPEEAWCAQGHARDEALDGPEQRCITNGGEFVPNDDSCTSGPQTSTGHCSTLYFYDTCASGSEPWVEEVCARWGDLTYVPADGCSP